MTKKIQKELADLGYDPIEVDEMVEMSVLENSISNLPQEVQDKFSLHNCYIDVQITQEDADELEELVRETVAEINRKEKGDWKEEFPEPKIDASNRFYFEQLASHLLKYHKRYSEQKELGKRMKNGCVEDEELLSLFE